MENIFEDIDRFVDGDTDILKVGVKRIGLERAPNPIIFITSERFLGQPKELFPSQFKVIRDFFELLCPNCNDLDAITRGEVPLEDQVLFEYDKCPRCGCYKYENPSRLVFYDELVGCAGMRSSKSTLAALIAHWILHEILCTDHLQERLGLIASQKLEGAFVAVSGVQAEETVWDHFIGMYQNSRWYQNYVLQLKEAEKKRGLPPGKLIRDKSTTGLLFGDRNIRIKSLHSNSSSLAGRTRIFAVIDELSRFDSGESKRGAMEVYRVMKRSLATVAAASNKLRSDGVYLPHARMISISAPIHKDDLIMRFLKQADKYPRMYTFREWTENMNPNITWEDLAPEFERDPIGAERDYHANPPGAENIFIEPDAVDLCIDDNRKNMFDLRERFFEVKTARGLVHYVTVDILDIRYTNLINYFIHCDPGEASDSFCIAVGHRENNKKIIDGAIEIRPVRKNKNNPFPRKVHFPSVLNILLYLNEKLSIAAISYDRWNSTDQTQRLIDAGVTTLQKNLSRTDHIDFRESIMSQTLSFPRPEQDGIDPTAVRNVPCAKAIHELKRLDDSGTKVDHPPGGSNDMIQCYIGVHRLIVQTGNLIKDQYTGPRGPRRSIGRIIRLRR